MFSTRRSILPALILATVPMPLAAQGVPGVMARWVMEGAGPVQEMTFYSAMGDAAMTRVEIGSEAIMITNGDTRIVLMPSQKMWMDLAEIEAMGAQMGMQAAAAAGASEDDLPDFEKTGETGTFAGTRCTYYRFTEGESVTDICAATGLGWGMGPSPGGGMMGARGGMPGRGAAGGRGGMGGMSAVNSEKYQKLQAAFADGFFPLEIKVVQGGNPMRMYATELEKRDLSADLFAKEGPAGYEKMSLFGRGRGRGGI